MPSQGEAPPHLARRIWVIVSSQACFLIQLWIVFGEVASSVPSRALLMKSAKPSRSPVLRLSNLVFSFWLASSGGFLPASSSMRFSMLAQNSSALAFKRSQASGLENSLSFHRDFEM